MDSGGGVSDGAEILRFSKSRPSELEGGSEAMAGKATVRNQPAEQMLPIYSKDAMQQVRRVALAAQIAV